HHAERPPPQVGVVGHPGHVMVEADAPGGVEPGEHVVLAPVGDVDRFVGEFGGTGVRCHGETGVQPGAQENLSSEAGLNWPPTTLTGTTHWLVAPWPRPLTKASGGKMPPTVSPRSP